MRKRTEFEDGRRKKIANYRSQHFLHEIDSIVCLFEQTVSLVDSLPSRRIDTRLNEGDIVGVEKERKGIEGTSFFFQANARKGRLSRDNR